MCLFSWVIFLVASMEILTEKDLWSTNQKVDYCMYKLIKGFQNLFKSNPETPPITDEAILRLDRI